MRPSFIAISLAFALTSGSPLGAQVRATAEIPAHMEFVLGDYATQDYTAKLTNRAAVPVVIRSVSKSTGEVTRTVTLPARGYLKLKVEQDETIIFVNDSDTYVEIAARLSYGVQGMSTRAVTKGKK